MLFCGAMKIFAHRGARKEAPENTLLAFQKALELGVDGIEFDILLTKDKVPVVTHNNDLSILTSYKGLLHQTPFSAIRDLNLGEGQIIPTLTEVLELVKIYPKAHAVLELKAQSGLAMDAAKLIGGLAQDILPPERFTLSSFSLSYLKAMKKHHSKLRRAWIVSRPPFTLVPFSFFDTFLELGAIHPCVSITSDRLVQKAHREGWEVLAWTVNDSKDWQKVSNLRVDGIFTDDPRWAMTL